MAETKLWLDDLRPAPPGWLHARTVPEARALLLRGDVVAASLDHDLGLGPATCAACLARGEAGPVPASVECACSCHELETGYDLCVWMAREGAWERLGYEVREGARPIGVVAPALNAGDTRGTSFFKRRSVYDAGDLETPPPALPSPAAPPADPGDRAGRLVEALEAWIKGSGLALVEGSPRANQHCWGATNGMVVWIQPHLRSAARAAVLAHEIAHVRLHYRFGRGSVLIVDDGEDREKTTLKELEAELTAFLILAIHGIDASGGAGMYLAQWEASREAVEAKFPVALDAAASIAGQLRRRRYRTLFAAAGSTSTGLRDRGPSSSREEASRSNLARRPAIRAAPRLSHPPSPATSHVYVLAART